MFSKLVSGKFLQGKVATGHSCGVKSCDCGTKNFRSASLLLNYFFWIRGQLWSVIPIFNFETRNPNLASKYVLKHSKLEEKGGQFYSKMAAICSFFEVISGLTKVKSYKLPFTFFFIEHEVRRLNLRPPMHKHYCCNLNIEKMYFFRIITIIIIIHFFSVAFRQYRYAGNFISYLSSVSYNSKLTSNIKSKMNFFQSFYFVIIGLLPQIFE